ncbi:MAG TPA: hypothetical protein VMT18_15135 [Planctomycetota bacterium]|nr:hypothetical protein [Planctomycetota bacterium]
MPRLRPSSCAALLALVPATAAQSVVTLISEGDAISGGGTVTSIERARTCRSTSDPNGRWLAVVGCDDPASDEVLLRDGVVYARVGDTAPQLDATQARIAGFGALGVDEWGSDYWLGDLWGTSQPTLEMQARFDGLAAGYETGSQVGVSTSSATFGAGSTWSEYLDLQVEGDVNYGAGLVLATIHDPTWPGGVRTLLAAGPLVTIGNCCFLDQWALSGEPAPLVGRAIESLRTQPWSAAATMAGVSPVLWSCDLEGSTFDDGCVFRSDFASDVLVARESSPSPVPGRVWGPLEDVSVDASTTGAHWTLRAHLDAGDPATDGVILLDGAVFAREGDVIAASAPAPIANLGGGRAIVTNAGSVFWYAAWNGPAGSVEAILLDDQPLLVTGSSVLGGATVADIDGGLEGFDATRTGSHVVARVTLDDGRAALVRVAVDGVQNYCTAKTNSNGCTPSLRWSGGPPSASAGSGFKLEGTGLIPLVPALLFYGLAGAAEVPFQGGTLCVAPPLTRLAAADTGGTISCTGKLDVDFNTWAASGVDPALVAGATVYAQVWYRDPGYAPPDDVGLTRGVVFTLAP